MATKGAKRRRRRKPTEGYAYEFHGSFSSKDKARAKARKVRGWFISRKVSGMSGLRYIVQSERAPF